MKQWKFPREEIQQELKSGQKPQEFVCLGCAAKVELVSTVYPVLKEVSEWLNIWKVNNEALLDALDRYGGYLINFDWPKDRLFREIHFIAENLGLVQTDLSSWYTDNLKHNDRDYDNFPLDEDVRRVYERLLERSERNKEISMRAPCHGANELLNVIKSLLEENANISQYFNEKQRPFFGLANDVKIDSVTHKLIRKFKGIEGQSKLLRTLVKIAKPLLSRIAKGS